MDCKISPRIRLWRFREFLKEPGWGDDFCDGVLPKTEQVAPIVGHEIICLRDLGQPQKLWVGYVSRNTWRNRMNESIKERIRQQEREMICEFHIGPPMPGLHLR
jgi:hypothetical protein